LTTPEHVSFLNHFVVDKKVDPARIREGLTLQFFRQKKSF
jgi:hypothetical protein